MTGAAVCEACKRPIPPRPYQRLDARACSPGCAGTIWKAENPTDRVWPKKPERLDVYGNAKPAAKDEFGGNGCVRVEHVEDDDDG
jgi:hypothetical protein